MKKLFLTLLMISGLTLSAQDLVVTAQQNLFSPFRAYDAWHDENITVLRIAPYTISGVKVSWRGITAGASYNGTWDKVFWQAGYTLTINLKGHLKCYGEGIKLGVVYGQVITPVQEPDAYNPYRIYELTPTSIVFSAGYQKGRWYGELNYGGDSFQPHIGIGIGYVFL